MIFLKRESFRSGSHSQRIRRSVSVMLSSKLSTAPGVVSKRSINVMASSILPLATRVNQRDKSGDLGAIKRILRFWFELGSAPAFPNGVLSSTKIGI